MEKIVEDIRASSLEAAKLRISIHKVDVGVVDDMARMFKEIEEQHEGKVVDILVSNAGYGKRIVDVWYAFPSWIGERGEEKM
jgi:3-oxoacyl-[acyl-carrier protein] reductase